MKYTETIKVHSAKTETIAGFLAANSLVRQLADGANPLDWLADQFLPDAGREEGFGDWIVRQVVQILETALLSDTVQDGRHVARKVAGVQISPEDRDWLFSALGHHPAVLAVWRTMAMDAIAA